MTSYFKRMQKKRNKRILWLVFLAVWWFIVTPLMFRAAFASRGYDAIGGEIFIPFFPLALWVFKKTINDIRKDLKSNDKM